MATISALITLACALIGGAGAAETTPTAPVVLCENLTLPTLSGLNVVSVQGSTVRNYTSAAAPRLSVDICNVTVRYTHQAENDDTWVNIWLPLTTWNGRFQATGGGGLAAGSGDAALFGATVLGYSAGTTDGGLTLNKTISPQTGQWALRRNGTLNESLVKNFAYRAIHDMTVIGKSLTQSFFGKAVSYSYYTGCSTGGRQGYFAAQMYPEDFDGIMANAPALNSPEISPGDYWPTVVMLNLGAPPNCVFDAYYNATLEYCDPLDGAKDGLISNLAVCNYNPQTLVGRSVACGGQNVTITTAFADVVSRIWAGSTSTNGEALFPGNPRGASFSGLANTNTTNGMTVPVPFSAAEQWIKYLAVQDPNYPTRNMTFADFDFVFERSVIETSKYLSTMSPSLAQFRNRGGKLLTWHGLADPLITPYGTMIYRSALSRQMALTQTQINDFYRVFFAPGVGHCSGGIGPAPIDPLGALVRWVESNQVPNTLSAAITVSPSRNITRNLCTYPQLLKYNGRGNVDDASSFTCAY